ncbi:hypothetical protein ASE61_00585 [Bosea sp. Root670]|uniref:hypothetical protein n=1 Tax=Bosea sp. Root670 TaxID=1736583 RepID=UPI0007156F8C|nr:hypothetical protein [Bosea sp. Root670]KRE08147.1 hypothetical protein ASE61_00585 [Bosea sp. Root670]
MGKLTKARREMLQDLLDGPKSGADHYPPNKWALANGYVTASPAKYSGTIFTITPAGRAALEPRDER